MKFISFSKFKYTVYEFSKKNDRSLSFFSKENISYGILLKLGGSLIFNSFSKLTKFLTFNCLSK